MEGHQLLKSNTASSAAQVFNFNFSTLADKPTKTSRKKIRKTVPVAHAYVMATFNNTMITITEPNGNTLAWASAGANGFKGTRKSTPYAATITAEKVAEKTAPYGVERLKVFVKGVGSGREQAVRGLHAAGFELEAIYDTTPSPHNGVRKRKSRRV